MKRILGLIVMFMIVGLGAQAEGNFISGEEAVIIAKADLQAYGSLTESELDSFTFESDEVEDRSDKGMGMVRCVHATYDVHPGLPDLYMAHYISATDGKVLKRFDAPFRDGKDFARYYHLIGACSEFLYAQETLEERLFTENCGQQKARTGEKDSESGKRNTHHPYSRSQYAWRL